MKKKFLLNGWLLMIATVLMFSTSSCSDDEEPGNGSSGNGTLNVNGVNLKVDNDNLSADYWPNSSFFMVHIQCGNGWEDTPTFMARFWDWNWDDVTIGVDLMSIHKGNYGYDCVINYFDPDYIYDFGIIKSGQIIVKSKDLSKKQIKLQFKDVTLEYDPLGGNYGSNLPTDKIINGEFLFTYEESL